MASIEKIIPGVGSFPPDLQANGASTAVLSLEKRPLSCWRLSSDVDGVLNYAPIAATAFAIPQFLPQLLKLKRSDDTAGVSWSWATLTSLNNAAWLVYFALSGFWTALAPAQTGNAAHSASCSR